MSEKRARYGRGSGRGTGRAALRLVGAGSASDAPASAPSSASTLGESPLATAIMHVVVGWVALCVERVAVAVDIQPIAERLYEVSVHYDAEQVEGIILRVRLDVEPGLVMRMVVEPVRPA